MLCFLVVQNERDQEKEIGKAAVVMKNSGLFFFCDRNNCLFIFMFIYIYVYMYVHCSLFSYLFKASVEVNGMR